MDAAPERRLTTILAADVAGYSRLMEADEPGTLARLKDYRAAIVEKIGGFRGRVVSTAGDSVLAEFSSVVNAVDCAVRIQRDLAERNAMLPEPRRMLFRIGVNLGDVLVMMTWHGYPWFMWPTLGIVVAFALRSVLVGWR